MTTTVLNPQDLDDLYTLFRFKKLPISANNIRAYAYKGSYFANVDIVLLKDDVEYEAIMADIQKTGYACSIRKYETLEDAKNHLFKGFFDFNSSNQNNKLFYESYVNKVESVIAGDYKYLPSTYYDYISNKDFTDNIVDKIVSNLSQEGPTLVVLEAAAGYGKTSTSYEVLNQITNQVDSNRIPLLAELSRNRQATIFKYVLYDEIDNKFTGINLDLVKNYIKEGWIPLIIDGFDELLKNKSDEENNFEDAEPMLETIKELLEGNAKILLTTRRTAIFSGDEFHMWIEKNFNDHSFNIHRYVLYPPSVNDWISVSRQNVLERQGLNLIDIANPVILSFVRSQTDEDFELMAKDTDGIIMQYVNKLLEREKERQNLLLIPNEQIKILEDIANHLVNQDLTYDNRDNIERVILEKNDTLFNEARLRYPVKDRPTVEQIASKFSMHAFLDRRGEIEERVGFVNDFVFGTFIGNAILKEKEWFGSERFVDYAVTAYKPRSELTREKIWKGLNYISEVLDFDRQLLMDVSLLGFINRTVLDKVINDVSFNKRLQADTFQIQNTVFNNCIFQDLQLFSATLENVNFISSKFYQCSLVLQNTPSIYLSGCEEHGSEISSLLEKVVVPTDIYPTNENQNEELMYYSKKVLEKFWPSGKDRFTINKLITTLKLGVSSGEQPQIERAVEYLIKNDLIIKEKGWTSIRLNVKKINDIRKILGR